MHMHVHTYFIYLAVIQHTLCTVLLVYGNMRRILDAAFRELAAPSVFSIEDLDRTYARTALSKFDDFRRLRRLYAGARGHPRLRYRKETASPPAPRGTLQCSCPK